MSVQKAVTDAIPMLGVLTLLAATLVLVTLDTPEMASTAMVSKKNTIALKIVQHKSKIY